VSLRFALGYALVALWGAVSIPRSEQVFRQLLVGASGHILMKLHLSLSDKAIYAPIPHSVHHNYE
jgi:hypothetical protein